MCSQLVGLTLLGLYGTLPGVGVEAGVLWITSPAGEAGAERGGEDRNQNELPVPKIWPDACLLLRMTPFCHVFQCDLNEGFSTCRDSQVSASAWATLLLPKWGGEREQYARAWRGARTHRGLS